MDWGKNGKIFTGNHGIFPWTKGGSGENCSQKKQIPLENKRGFTREKGWFSRRSIEGGDSSEFWPIHGFCLWAAYFFPTLFQGKTSKTYWLQSCKGNGSRGVWTSSKVCWRGWNPWMVSCWWAAVRSMWRPISLSKTAWRWKLITFLNMSFTFHAYSGYFCMIIVGGGSSFSILLYNFG